MKKILFFAMAVIVVTVALGGSAHSATFTFTQNTPLVFAGTTLSSVLAASGVTGNVTDVNVTLTGLRVNTFGVGIEEHDILLVGPQGQKIILMSYACDGTAGPVNFEFDGAAGAGLPSGESGSTCASGTFLPSDHSVLVGGYILDAPAPAPPYSTNLADFNALDANGNWTLYAEEFGGDEGGTIDSWELTIETDATGCAYEELFDDGVLTYLQLNPSVTETGGNLVLSPTRKKAYGVSDATFAGMQNGTITTEVMFASGGEPKSKGWIYTHWVDKKNTVEVLIDPVKGRVTIKQRAGVVIQKARGNFAFALDTLYEVAINYDGTDYEVSVDGTSVVTLVPAGTLPSGILGFASRGFDTSVNSICTTP